MPPRPLLPFLLLLLAAAVPGCFIHDPPPPMEPALASWAPGWQLNYTSGDGWMNYTVVAHEDLNGTPTYVVQVATMPGQGFPDEPDLEQRWLDRRSLGMLAGSSFGFRFQSECAVGPVLPVANATYSCRFTTNVSPWREGTLTGQHLVGATRDVTLPFGTFTETETTDVISMPHGTQRTVSAYSPEIGYLTRFQQQDGPEYVLHSMTMRRVARS